MAGRGTLRNAGGKPRARRGRALALVVALIAAVAAVGLPTTANAATTLCNVPITMSDGIVLRGNLWLPSAPDGGPVGGAYPTVGRYSSHVLLPVAPD